MPSELNFRANIFGMKMLGVGSILSASAVGSLRADFEPLHIVVPDQFFDRTAGRTSTFFGRGLVAHVAFAHPLCRGALRHRRRERGTGGRDRAPGRHVRVHGRAAVLDRRRVERLPAVGHGHHRHDQPAGGEARARGGDLLRDDCARDGLRLLAPGPRLGDRRDDHPEPDRRTPRPPGGSSRMPSRMCPAERTCPCASALATAIITRPDAVPPEIKRELAPIVGKYLK